HYTPARAEHGRIFPSGLNLPVFHAQAPVARVARACYIVSKAGEVMRLKLYCNRYGHFKDALVCSVSCVYRTRCNDFALFYDANRADVDSLVADYYDARRGREGQKRSGRSNIDPAL